MNALRSRAACALLLSLLLSGCATLGQVIQPPRFDAADSRSSELRLLGPSLRNPAGGVAIRLWTRVSNPNPFGLTLARLAGTLALQGTRAADVDFPLGVPLPAARDTVIPLDIEVGFANLPALAQVLPAAISRGAVQYQLHGSFAVDAGVLGQPTFGPSTLLQGAIDTRR